MASKKKTISEKEQERVTYWLNRAKKMWEAKQEYSRRWEEYEKVYHLFVEKREGEDERRASFSDSWSFATVKTAQSAFVDSRVMPVITQHEDDDTSKASDIRDLYIDNAEKGNLDRELYYTRLDALKLGMGFLKTVYVEDKRNVYTIEKFDPETNKIIYKKEEKKDFDDVKTVRVSPWMMLVDDQTRADFGTARDCIELEIIPYDEAKRKYAHLVGEEVFEERVKKGDEPWNEFVEAHSTHLAQTADDNTGTAREFRSFRFFAPLEVSEDNVVVMHCWQRVPHDSYEILINGAPIRVHTDQKESPIPYIHKELPYTPIPYSPYSGDEFWAAGIIEIARTDANAIKKNREMMSDRQKVSLFSPAFSNVNDEIDQRNLKLKPLSIIRTKGGVPTQFHIPGITNADLQLLDRDENSLKRAVGIDERVLGMSPEGTRLTATEVSFLREAALKRLKEFSFLYKNSLLREVWLKIKLYDQYYASPLKREKHTKNDGLKELAAKAHQFKVKTDNKYTKKSVNHQMFEGDFDLDIDMQVLLPLTQAELITKWGQYVRDVTPFIQGGVVNRDFEKIFNKYESAMEINGNALKHDVDGESILLAEGEHRLLANKNTSQETLERLLPNGTSPQFLTAMHLKRHMELMSTDDAIEESELRNLIKHIDKDRRNFEIKMQQEQARQMQQPVQVPSGFGGVVEQKQI